MIHPVTISVYRRFKDNKVGRVPAKHGMQTNLGVIEAVISTETIHLVDKDGHSLSRAAKDLSIPFTEAARFGYPESPYCREYRPVIRFPKSRKTAIAK